MACVCRVMPYHECAVLRCAVPCHAHAIPRPSPPSYSLSKAKIAELEAQRRILETNAAMYDDLLNNLTNEEKKRQSLMSKEERLAHERLMAKMVTETRHAGA